jgi:hypothetical protein
MAVTVLSVMFFLRILLPLALMLSIGTIVEKTRMKVG